MIKIAVSGSKGLIGSRFISLLNKDFNLYEFNHVNGFDITDINQVFNLINQVNQDIIVHFAAKTDVDSCEKDRIDDFNKLTRLGILDKDKIIVQKINSQDWRNGSSAFSINVAGTKNLADICLRKNIKMVYISTDFVFGGFKDYYNEEDSPDPINWYGQTKYWGERIVSEMLENYDIIRLSFPYGFKNPAKKDFVWKIYELLKSGNPITLVEDQIITPTFIDDIVSGLGYIINKNMSGLYHLVGESFTTPCDAGKLIARKFLTNDVIINGIKANDYYKDRARRGFKLRLKNDKLKRLGFKTKTLEEGLEIIRKSL